MKAIREAYLALAYYFAVSVFIVASFLINLLCLVVGWIPGSGVLKRPLRRTLQFLFRRWAWFMGFIRVLDLRTPERTKRKKTQGEIWVMNHPSILDASYLLKFISDGTCIYKPQIASNPLYGAVARLAQYIPNVGGPDLVRMGCEALENGEDLVIFPEGTRTTVVDVDAFKSGFALIAKRSKSPVNVMWMESPPDFMTREASFWRVPGLTAKITIERIARIDSSQFRAGSGILEAVKESYRTKVSQCS